MDQFSTLLGRRDHALFLDCRPDPDGIYTLDHVPVPPVVRIVLLNSGVQHENVRSEFNQRVAECKIGVRLLQGGYPEIAALRDVTPSTMGLTEARFWRTLESLLPVRATRSELVARGLDQDWLEHIISDHRLDAQARFAVFPRCRHVISENQRVLDGTVALRGSQTETFGALMNESHASMSEDYQASCPEADALAQIARRRPEVLGARITGAGWGGGVVALARNSGDTSWVDNVLHAYRESTSLDSDAFVCQPGGGASHVRL
jgi:galactokinase